MYLRAVLVIVFAVLILFPLAILLWDVVDKALRNRDNKPK